MVFVAMRNDTMNGHRNTVGRLITGIPLIAAALWGSALFLIYLDLVRAGSTGAEITGQMGWGAAMGVDLLLRHLGYCAWGVPAVLALWGVCRIGGVRGGSATRWGLVLLIDAWLGMLIVYALRGGETAVLVGTFGRDAVGLASQYVGTKGTAVTAGVLAAVFGLAGLGRRRPDPAARALELTRQRYPESVAALRSALSQSSGGTVVSQSRPFFAPGSTSGARDTWPASAQAEPEAPAEAGPARRSVRSRDGAAMGVSLGVSQTVIRLRLVAGLFMVVAGLWVAASLLAQAGSVFSGVSQPAHGTQALGTMSGTLGTLVLTHLGLLGFVLPVALVLWGINRLAGEAIEVAALRTAWLASQSWVLCLVGSALAGDGSRRYVGNATASVAAFAVSHLGVLGTVLAAAALAAAVIILIRTEQAEMARRPRHVVIFHGLGAFLKAAAFGIGFLVGRVSAARQKASPAAGAALATAGAGAGSAPASVAGIPAEAAVDARAARETRREADSAEDAHVERPARALDRDILESAESGAGAQTVCETPELLEEDERLLNEAAMEDDRTEPAAPVPPSRPARRRSEGASTALAAVSRGIADAGRLVGRKAGEIREGARRRAAEREKRAPRPKRQARPAAAPRAKAREPRASALNVLATKLRAAVESAREKRSTRASRPESPARAASRGLPSGAWRTGAVAIIVYVAIVNAAYFFALRPAQVHLNQLCNEKTTIHDFFVVTESSEAVERFKGNLMRGDQRITVLSQLEQYARETGVRIIDEPSLLQTSELSENVGEHPIEMTLQGSYHGIAAFVSRVEGPDRVLAIRDLEIEAAENGAKEHHATLLIAAMSWRD